MADPGEEPPILTRVESEVMAILWQRGCASVHDVVAAMPRELAYTSLLTVLRILVKKGYVQHEPHPDGSCPRPARAASTCGTWWSACSALGRAAGGLARGRTLVAFRSRAPAERDR